jgi:acyl-CoA thioesterase II
MDSLTAKAHQDIAVASGRLSPEETAELLVLEAIEVDTFRGRGVPGEPGRLFGGQVAAQALAAAAATVTGTRPHSLHAYFLRPGDASRPVLLQVDRLHDGRTFRRRRMSAVQGGEHILSLECSFTADASDATDYPPTPPVPAPGDCPSYSKDSPATQRLTPWNLIEARRLPGCEVPLSRETAVDFWFRFRVPQVAGVLPEVMLTYLSDLTLASTTVRPTNRHPAGRRDVTGVTSLDHSLWFHARPDLSGWLLYSKTASVGGPTRSIATGRIYNRDGTLVAFVIQEVLLHSRPEA